MAQEASYRRRERPLLFPHDSHDVLVADPGGVHLWLVDAEPVCVPALPVPPPAPDGGGDAEEAVLGAAKEGVFVFAKHPD